MDKVEKNSRNGNGKATNVLHSTYFTKCDSCDFITKRPSDLKNHKRCFIFKCKLCDFKTSSIKKYVSHKKDEHIEESIVSSKSSRFKCEKCDFSTKAQSLLSLHSKRNCFKYACSFCVFKTSVRSTMSMHKQKVHSKIIEEQLSFQCDECDERFSHNYLLTRHQQKHHNGEVFRCNQCDFYSLVEVELKGHLKKVHNFGHRFEDERDTQVYPCNICALKFVGKTEYRMHLFTHKMEKRGEFFTCTDCSHMTNKEEDLMKHLQLKHFKLEYRCNFCKVTFGRLDSFRVHLVSKHEDKKENLHKCDRCQYATRRKDAMVRHIRQTHERVRVYCDFCDYKSVDMRSLKGHVERKHLGKLQIFLDKISKNSKNKSDRIYL